MNCDVILIIVGLVLGYVMSWITILLIGWIQRKEGY